MAVKTFTAGDVLTASDTNTYLANPGLVFVKETTFASSATWDFTSAFSSTYRNYVLVITSASASAGGAIVYTQMLSGTTPNTAASYASYESGNTWAGVADNTSFGTTATAWFAVRSDSFFFSTMTLYSPNLAIYTSFSSEGVDAAESWQARGYHAVNTSYDGIRFYRSSGSMSGTVTCYGIRIA